MYKILEKEVLQPNMLLMKLDAPLIAQKAEPGQFIILIVDEKGERIPLTIADSDPIEKTITIVFQEMGKSTHYLATKNMGDSLADILGPLGNPTEIEETDETVVVIGGGIGVAPIFPLARKLHKMGKKVIAIIGYRSKDLMFWEDKMRDVSNELLVATNDGSYGDKGFVTDVLKKLMSRGEKIHAVYAIGPAIMMKAVADMTRDKLKTYVSLNSLMVCGMGMCGACRVVIDGETKFTCADGPDFDAHKVDFKELMDRLTTYKDEEKISFDKWQSEVNHG